jgi:hypothetical protein
VYHSTVYTNKEIKRLLGDRIDDFVLASISGKPARTKHKMVVKGNKVTIFGGDFIAKGYFR